MDNLAPHKVHGVREALVETGARPPYLPSYSPEYNPIELCFSKFKDYLRSAAAWTKEGLINQGFNRISPQDSAAWIKNYGYGLLYR